MSLRLVRIEDVPVNTPCRIVSLEGEAAAILRVQEMGMTAGTTCTIVRKGFLGGPMELTVNRTHLGYRASGNLQILVELLNAA